MKKIKHCKKKKKKKILYALKKGFIFNNTFHELEGRWSITASLLRYNSCSKNGLNTSISVI